MTPEDALIPTDVLSAFVHEHAERALQGLLRIESTPVSELEDALSVETVHDLRTSLRRLRAVRRTFSGSFTAAAAVPASTDGDLRFVARTLSELRDVDVLGEGLRQKVEELPPALVLGPVREDLSAALSRRRQVAVEHVALRHGRTRWRRSVEQLSSWVQDPPRLLEQDPLALLESTRDEVRDRLRAAGEDPRALHSVRRTAKRYRYAAELLLPHTSGARAHYEAATTVHTRLGLMQDAVVAEEFLLEHASTAEHGGHNAFTLGVLHQRAQQQIEEITAQAPDLL